MNIQTYDKIFQQLLQSKIAIKINNRVIKTGKLKLFVIKQYFIRLHLENDKNVIKVLELPYPFNINYNKEKGCTLNYRLTSLCNNQPDTMTILKNIKPVLPNKMYDNEVEIVSIT